jgi:hypothetical protein
MLASVQSSRVPSGQCRWRVREREPDWPPLERDRRLEDLLALWLAARCPRSDVPQTASTGCRRTRAAERRRCSTARACVGPRRCRRDHSRRCRPRRRSWPVGRSACPIERLAPSRATSRWRARAGWPQVAARSRRLRPLRSPYRRFSPLGRRRATSGEFLGLTVARGRAIRLGGDRHP